MVQVWPSGWLVRSMVLGLQLPHEKFFLLCSVISCYRLWDKSPTCESTAVGLAVMQTIEARHPHNPQENCRSECGVLPAREKSPWSCTTVHLKCCGHWRRIVFVLFIVLSSSRLCVFLLSPRLLTWLETSLIPGERAYMTLLPDISVLLPWCFAIRWDCWVEWCLRYFFNCLHFQCLTFVLMSREYFKSILMLQQIALP